MVKEKEEQFKRKIEVAEEKVKQSEAMAEVYKQFVQKRRELFDEEDESYLRVRDFSVRGSAMKERRNK